MADMAIRIEGAFPGTITGSEKDWVEAIASGVRKIGRVFGEALGGSKNMARRMEGYRCEVASRVPFHAEHV